MEAKTITTNQEKKFKFFRTAVNGYLEIDINQHPEALDVISHKSLMSSDCTKIYAEQDKDAARVMEALSISADQIEIVQDPLAHLLANTFRLDGSINNFGFSVFI
jgi:hypothetical protein